MDYNEAVEIMCKRCINYEVCMGTGCEPKKTLQANAPEEWNVIKYDEEEGCLYNLPDYGQRVLLSDNGYVTDDTYYDDNGAYFDSGNTAEEGMAWKPLPEPYKENKTDQ